MSELEKYQQIFERDPTDLQAFNNVCEAAEKAKDYEYLTELLKYRTQITGDQAEIVDLLFRAGVVYLEKMDDVPRGVEVLLQAFDIDQAHAGIGARLENAYIEAGDFEAALAIIEGRLNAIGSSDIAGTQLSIRSDIHFQAGELLQDRVGDKERALNHYRKAIELDKTNAGALGRAREIYLELSKFKNAAKLCELEARGESDIDRKVQLYRELAYILSHRMNDMSQAITALKRALKADQNNDDVKLELAETIANSPWDPANSKDRKWASDYLTRRARQTEGEAGLQMGCLGIRAYPTNEKALAVSGARAREIGDFQTLIVECQTACETLSSIEEQAPVIRRIVKSFLRTGAMGDALKWAEKLEPVADEKDIALIRKLRESSAPESASTLDSEFSAGMVSVVPRGHSESPDTAFSNEPSAPVPTPISEAPVLDALTVPLEPPDDMPLDEWIGALHQEANNARRMGDDDMVQQIMRAIVTHHPGDQKAITFLERRFRSTENWGELRDLLLQCVQSDEFPPAVKTVKLRQAAKLAEENLNDIDGAIEIWYQIKAHDPKVRDARDALERLLAHTERWEELVTLYREEIESTSSRSKKVAAWQRLAEIFYIRLNDATLAADAYQQIIELAPDDLQAVNALDELYLREQMYDQLVPFLDHRADAAKDKMEKKHLTLRAASLLQERLGLFEDAYQKARDILEFFPGDLDAIELMEAVDETGENWERLIDTLNLKARVTREKSEKVAAYKKVAIIASVRMEDAALALKAWNKVLDVDPCDDEAMETAVGIYESTDEWGELARILKLRIVASEDNADKVRSYRKLATILEFELGKQDEAVHYWKNLLEIEEDAEALGALSRWHESNKDWGALSDILPRLVPLLDDPEAKSDAMYRRANLFYRQMGLKEKAIEELVLVSSEINPAHLPTLELLRDIYAQDSNYDAAATVLEQQIANTSDAEALRQLYIQLGEWSRNELADIRRAMVAYEKAASMDVRDDAVLDKLDEIFVETEEWDKLLKMIYGRYQRSEDDDARFGYLVRGGQLCEEKLVDTKQAWGWYRQIFDNMRTHPDALEVIEEAGHRMSLWKELIDVYGKLTKEGTDDEKLSWWMKISQLFEEKLDEPASALEAVLRAFGLDPDNEEMLDSVDRLAVRAQAWDRLATVYTVLAKREDDAEGKIEKLLRHADVLYKNAQEPGMAFDVALKAFELDPSSEDMLQFVEEVGRASLRFNDMVTVYKVCADREADKARKIELLMKSASMFLENMDDGDGALKRAADALVVAPFDEENVKRVWDFIRNMENGLMEAEKGIYWNRLITMYRQIADVFHRDTNRQVQLTLTISRVYAEELHQTSQAFAVLKEAQQLAPADQNTIDQLEEMAGELDLWEDLVEHYRNILDETFEMSTAVMYHRRRARILVERLDQKDEAAEHYWQIIQLDSQDDRAYESLLSYYENAGKWNDLVNLLERQLNAASDDEKRQQLLLQIAEIWENKIGNRYEAKDWYGQVVTLWPDNEEARQALDRLASADKVGSYDDEDDDSDIKQLVSLAPPPSDKVVPEVDASAENPEESGEPEDEPGEESLLDNPEGEESDEEVANEEESEEEDVEDTPTEGSEEDPDHESDEEDSDEDEEEDPDDESDEEDSDEDEVELEDAPEEEPEEDSEDEELENEPEEAAEEEPEEAAEEDSEDEELENDAEEASEEAAEEEPEEDSEDEILKDTPEEASENEPEDELEESDDEVDEDDEPKADANGGEEVASSMDLSVPPGPPRPSVAPTGVSSSAPGVMPPPPPPPAKPFSGSIAAPQPGIPTPQRAVAAPPPPPPPIPKK